MAKNQLKIRDGAVGFLAFTKDAYEEGSEAHTGRHVWLTQRAISQLFSRAADMGKFLSSKHI